ncbi:MAG: cytochrome c biogenesis CcdA family protein [Desulfobacterales bacterium]|nr:cytochrome c biogenesis CcdA family protein [Desulfobacterales bacterium]
MDMLSLYANATFLVVVSVLFGLGAVSGLSPCSLPTVALVVSYVSKNSSTSKVHGFLFSLSFVLGIALVLTLLGGISGYTGSFLTQGGSLFSSTATVGTRVFVSFVFLFFILLGLWMLGKIKFQGFNFMTKMNVKKESGAYGAFLLGLPFGIAASPCTFPVTIAVLLYVSTKDVFSAMALMFIYTIGRSIPILVAGTSTNLLKKLQGFSRWQNRIDKAAGITMVVIGLFFLLKMNLPYLL